MRLARLVTSLMVLGLLAGSQPASAALIFADNFNTENGGVGKTNFASFTNWNVSGGTVDLIGNGYFQLGMPPAYKLFVDMDGSTGNAGKMTSKASFAFLSGHEYTLSFELAGNQRNTAAESVIIQVKAGALVSQTVSLTKTAPFTPFSYSFIGDGTAGALSFEGTGGDNIGMLLDNVSLSVPEPVSLWLLGAGLLGLAGRHRPWR